MSSAHLDGAAQVAVRLLLQARHALGRQAPQLCDEPVQEGLVAEVRLRAHLHRPQNHPTLTPLRTAFRETASGGDRVPMPVGCWRA